MHEGNVLLRRGSQQKERFVRAQHVPLELVDMLFI